jgi:hypothetical protein
MNTFIKYFARFMMLFCSVFFLYGIINRDYVSALIQLVCLLINTNTYMSARARELVINKTKGDKEDPK